MKILIQASVLLASLVAFLPVVRADEPATPAQRYVLEDFETECPLFWPGNAFDRGRVETELTTVHHGKRACLMEWDLSDGVGKMNNFFRMNFDPRNLVGLPSGIDVWVHADTKEVGTDIAIGLTDAKGQWYSILARIDKPGWHPLHFDLDSISGWKQASLPVAFRWLGVDAIFHVPLAGKIVVDDVTVTTTDAPRDRVLARVFSDDFKGIAYSQPLALQFQLKNLSSKATGALQFSVEADDSAGIMPPFTWQSTIPNLTGSGGTVTLPVPFSSQIPHGAWIVHWKVSDATGDLSTGNTTASFARLTVDNAVSQSPAGPAEKLYNRDYNPLGGAFYATAEQMASTGASWARYEVDWRKIESKPQQYDFTAEKTALDRILANGLNIVDLTTIYGGPDFYKAQDLDFAPAYGRFQAAQAQALEDRIEMYELGNEDNGPSKFLYTEIGRNGAAGVRSSNFDVPVSNSATAGVDLNWLKIQGKRGLVDRLDDICTHPYTGDSSPEEYDLDGQLEKVNEFIDDNGGMKNPLTTEWGYHAKPEGNVSQIHHAEWMPRHLAIAAGQGMLRHGLYAYDLYFGIYTNGHPYPAGVSVNAYYHFTYAHSFAGWLKKGASGYAAVYEKAGVPLIMAWMANGQGTLTLENEQPDKLKAHDLYGNPIPLPLDNGAIKLTESPIYIEGLSRETLRQAWMESADEAQKRFARVLQVSSWAGSEPWKTLSTQANVDADKLKGALSSWKPTAPLDPHNQAVIAQTLRWLIVATKLQAIDPGASQPAAQAIDPELRLKALGRLKKIVSRDCDLPALRWILKLWDQAQKQQAMCIELGNHFYANRVATLDPVFDGLAKKIADTSPQVFFPIWPYVHAPLEGNQLQETLQFTPGKPTPVAVRLNSYSARSYSAEVRIEAPAGWTVQPPGMQGTIEAGSSSELRFSVTANDVLPTGLAAVLKVPGKPEVRIPLDDAKLLPALVVEAPVLSQLLPGTPLPLAIHNNGVVPIQGRLRLLGGPDLPPLLRTDMGEIQPGATSTLSLNLPPGTPAPPFNQWPLVANVVTADGKESNTPLTIDFDVCTQASTPVDVAAGLDQWVNTAPLHLDKEEYTHGSYSDGWTPSDLSGVVYTQWDSQNFYLAADVVTPVFNQALSGFDMYQQDSVQFFLAPASGGISTQFGIALTPKGMQVWDYRRNQLAPGAKLDVKVVPGHTIYQVSVPWSAMPEIQPAAGQKCRFDVAFNHWDVGGGRRFIERYGEGIIHGTNEAGWLNFSGPPEASHPAATTSDDTDVIFREDFEEYNDGQIPDTWKMVGGNAPVPESVVRAGVGRNGSKALEMTNHAGGTPNVFRNLTRPLAGLIGGKRYRLSAWVKGGDFKGPIDCIGICSDIWGNEGFTYIPPWTPSDDWQQVSLDFTAPPGAMRIILRNDFSVDGLLIDDVEIKELPD